MIYCLLFACLPVGATALGETCKYTVHIDKDLTQMTD
jgi:hypothetical protein